MRKVIALLLIFSLFIPITSTAKDANTNNMPLELRVVGNKVVNSRGEEVRLVGVSVPSMSWGNGEKEQNDSIKMALDNWNANHIRLTLTQKFWYGREWYINDGGSSYRKKVQEVVDMVTKRGKYVIIDLHEYKIPNENSVNFWKDVAAVYKNHPGVLFDILNEPHSVTWKQWRDGGPVIGDSGELINSPGMQGLVDAIRGVGAKNIIIAGGLDWAYDLRGLQKGYDGLENGYALDDRGGNGIIYSAHVYPLKIGEEDDWAEKVGCVINDYPIYIGEFGFFQERVTNWYDFRHSDYVEWMNAWFNYMNTYNLHYAAWNFHVTSSPCSIMNWEFKPTPYSGIFQKFNMIMEPDTRPEIPEIEDKHPVFTWKKIVDFDTVNPEWGVYKKENAGYFAIGDTEGIEGNGKIIAYDTPANSAGAIADIPEDWDLSGTTCIWLNVKSDGDIKRIGIGFELNDGRQFKVTFPTNLYKNWQRFFFPIACFKGEYGVLDTREIKSIFITNESDGAGSFAIDNITIAGTEYVEHETFKLYEDFETKGSMVWEAWADTESTDSDSFTTKWVKNGGRNGGGAQQFWFNRPAGSYGGQARGTLPESWDISKIEYATHMSFWIKGSGDLDLLIRLEEMRSKPQKSLFDRRDLEVGCAPVKVRGTDWQKVTIRLSELGLSEGLELEFTKYISIFNMNENASGSFIIDDLVFTNEPLPLEEKYEMHPEPQLSEEITELPQKFPDHVVIQVPKEEGYIFKAGEKGYLNFAIHNKTDARVIGELKIEQMPDGFEIGANETVQYGIQGRHKVNKAFEIIPPANAEGEYKITVVDTNENGVLPMEYVITVIK